MIFNAHHMSKLCGPAAFLLWQRIHWLKKQAQILEVPREELCGQAITGLQKSDWHDEKHMKQTVSLGNVFRSLGGN